MSEGAILNRETQVDLSGYVTIEQMNQAIQQALTNYVTQSALNSSLSNYATTAQLNNLQTQVNDIEDEWELVRDWGTATYNYSSITSGYLKIEAICYYDLQNSASPESRPSNVWIIPASLTSGELSDVDNNYLGIKNKVISRYTSGSYTGPNTDSFRVFRSK